MKIQKDMMGMPITVEVCDPNVGTKDIENVFTYFSYVDETFSTYKKGSEISRINRGELPKDKWSADMKLIFDLCEKTKRDTSGYFDISHNGSLDPSGLVKGWAIRNATMILKNAGFRNYYVEAGGDIQVGGKNAGGSDWKVGIRNPFNRKEVVKIVYLNGRGIATSGTYIRNQHIYNPHLPGRPLTEIVSLTVIGPNVYEADRFATAAFAMQRSGIGFIGGLNGFEGYMIDNNGVATYTAGFNNYVEK